MDRSGSKVPSKLPCAFPRVRVQVWKLGRNEVLKIAALLPRSQFYENCYLAALLSAYRKVVSAPMTALECLLRPLDSSATSTRFESSLDSSTSLKQKYKCFWIAQEGLNFLRGLRTLDRPCPWCRRRRCCSRSKSRRCSWPKSPSRRPRAEGWWACSKREGPEKRSRGWSASHSRKPRCIKWICRMTTVQNEASTFTPRVSFVFFSSSTRALMLNRSTFSRISLIVMPCQPGNWASDWLLMLLKLKGHQKWSHFRLRKKLRKLPSK